MPHSAVSDVGLHCLPMSHRKDARLIGVNLLVLRHISAKVVYYIGLVHTLSGHTVSKLAVSNEIEGLERLEIRNDYSIHNSKKNSLCN